MMSVRHRSSCVDRLQPSRGTGGMSSTERTPEDGPVALVTGAAGGIGSAVVAAFEAAGHRVLGIDRDEADLTDADQAAGAVAGALQRYGRLDAVVCAHGGSGRRFGDGPV